MLVSTTFVEVMLRAAECSGVSSPQRPAATRKGRIGTPAPFTFRSGGSDRTLDCSTARSWVIEPGERLVREADAASGRSDPFPGHTIVDRGLGWCQSLPLPRAEPISTQTTNQILGTVPKYLNYLVGPGRFELPTS